jgi:MoaA/NifB/PqqE/SkfB family radical SAM enzyme
VLGNVREQAFKDIWTGGPYRELRRRFRAGSRTMPLCADCSEAFEGGSLGTDDIIDTRFFTA